MHKRVIGGTAFPLPRWIAGKVSSPESTHPKPPAERVAPPLLSPSDERGHRGSRLPSRLIVLEALICRGSARESGGNLLGPVVFIGRLTPRWAKTTFLMSSPSGPRKVKMPRRRKAFLVCLCLEMSTSAVSSRLFGQTEGPVPRRVLNMPLVVLT